MKGFTPRERNGIIALGCVVLLCLAVGPIVSLSGCSGKETQTAPAEVPVSNAHADTTNRTSQPEEVIRSENPKSQKRQNKKSKGKSASKSAGKSAGKSTRKSAGKSSGTDSQRRSLRDEKFE